MLMAFGPRVIANDSIYFCFIGIVKGIWRRLASLVLRLGRGKLATEISAGAGQLVLFRARLEERHCLLSVCGNAVASPEQLADPE